MIKHPAGYGPERQYVFKVIFDDFLGTTFEAAEDPNLNAVHIATYGGGDHGSVTVADGLFATPPEDWLGDSTLPHTPLDAWEKPSYARLAGSELTLPVIFGPRGPTSASDERLAIPFDLFGSVFFMLTSYQEAVVDIRDEHGRFPSSASLPASQGFLSRPLVDEYVEVLWRMLRARWPGLQRRLRHYRLLPTHDVDWPFVAYRRPVWRVAKHSIGDLLHRRGASLAYRRLRSVLTSDPKIDPANTFDFIMSQNERHSLQSEFYFRTEQSSPLDGVYDFNHPSISEMMSSVHSRGHRLGLHASYESYRDRVRLRREFSRLIEMARASEIEQDSWGSRQHYLRWENPTTWRNLDEVGLDHDSTLGFADHVGFRSGTCHEYPVFDLKRSMLLNLRERPLIAMDQTLMHPNYMYQSPDDTTRWVTRLADACRLYGGTFVLLWHNSTLTTDPDKRLYCELLDAAGS